MEEDLMIIVRVEASRVGGASNTSLVESKNRYNGHRQQPFSSLGDPRHTDCRSFVRPSYHTIQNSPSNPPACLHALTGGPRWGHKMRIWRDRSIAHMSKISRWRVLKLETLCIS